MKRIQAGLAAVLFLGVGLATGVLAHAETTPAAVKPSTSKVAPFPPSVIAIIDVQRILQESLAAKSVQHQLEAQRAKFQGEISGEETGLRKAEEELAKAHDNVTPEVYADREQKLRQRFLVVERHVQARRKALDQAFTDSMNVVRKSVLDIVAATAHDHGANLVVVKQQTLWSSTQIDITDDVLSKLNKALAEVPVKVTAEDEKAKDKDEPEINPVSSKSLKR